jgi:hypothetical protein
MTPAQAADYRHALSQQSAAFIASHIAFLGADGGWNSFTPHKQEIAADVLKRKG